MIKCPVCRLSTGSYKAEGAEPGTWKWKDYPLYQRSYPGEKEYVSPRCESCFDKVMVGIVQW